SARQPHANPASPRVLVQSWNVSCGPAGDSSDRGPGGGRLADNGRPSTGSANCTVRSVADLAAKINRNHRFAAAPIFPGPFGATTARSCTEHSGTALADHPMVTPSVLRR